jgi:hypothetical protein
MIKIKLGGDFKNTEKFFNGAKNKLPRRIKSILDKYGILGVIALQNYTPKDSGETANSWKYNIFNLGIEWYNTNITSNGTPIAILLQYGHGTINGGYVQGKEYINQALQPIFNEIADNCWKEVKNL